MGNLVTSLNVSLYTIPTDEPESDGTYKWDHTTMILVTIGCGGIEGIGYTYGNRAVGDVIVHTLKELVVGSDCLQIESITASMRRHVRNDGNCGIAFMAVSAVDIALWDLKAKLMGVPLVSLLGAAQEKIRIYGSGGFTSYTIGQIEKQFGDWAASGISAMKMKVGTHPDDDVSRVRAAKAAIGPERSLYVDANGAYSVRQALRMADEFSQSDVRWFEEPVSSDDLNGLRIIREHVPSGMNIAAGEYGYNLPYFSRMIGSGAVDVLQADATRCGGITGFIKVGHLCECAQIRLSSHCAPAVHLHAALSQSAFMTAEYFHDHVRIEKIFFDGVAEPVGGMLSASDMPGLGIRLKEKDAERYKVS